MEGHVGVFDVPVDIEIATADGRATHTVESNEASQIFTFAADSDPLMVVFDKEDQILKSVEFKKDAGLRAEFATTRAPWARWATRCSTMASGACGSKRCSRAAESAVWRQKSKCSRESTIRFRGYAMLPCWSLETSKTISRCPT